jgi:hypothetical protein
VSDRLITAVASKGQSSQLLTSDSVLRLVKGGFSDSFVFGLVNDAEGRYATDSSRLVEMKEAGASERVLSAMVRKSPPQEPLTADGVARLAGAGFTDTFILDLIQQQPTRFTLPTDRIVALRTAGVSERVLSAMLGKSGGEIPAGTSVTIRLIDAIDSRENKTGDEFDATLAEALVVNGAEVAPRGADAKVRLVEEKESGRLTGRTELSVALVSLSLQGREIPLESSVVEQQSGSQTADTGKRAAVVGGIGAVIGAIAGGGKGAAIGAGAGAAAGAGSQVFTKGQRVQIPSETLLTFTLPNRVEF